VPKTSSEGGGGVLELGLGLVRGTGGGIKTESWAVMKNPAGFEGVGEKLVWLLLLLLLLLELGSGAFENEFKNLFCLEVRLFAPTELRVVFIQMEN